MGRKVILCQNVMVRESLENEVEHWLSEIATSLEKETNARYHHIKQLRQPSAVPRFRESLSLNLKLSNFWAQRSLRS